MKKEVLKLEEKNQIRELYYEHGYSKSKIERVTKHNRRTISNCVAKDSFSEEKKMDCQHFFVQLLFGHICKTIFYRSHVFQSTVNTFIIVP